MPVARGSGGVEASSLYMMVYMHTSAIAEGRAPIAARPFFAGGRPIGLPKPGPMGTHTL